VYSERGKGGDMMIRKDLIIAVLATFCLAVTLFTVIPIRSSPYDPWLDLNDDGHIDGKELGDVAAAFGTYGTPINKTELLLGLNLEMYWINFQDLPAYASIWGKYLDSENILLKIDVDPALGDQRIIAVDPGATVTINLTFQLWTAPGIIKQSFVVYSWTPSWPPPSGYYVGLYNGAPGNYPGATVTTNFALTAPSTPGRYYLWFCGDAQYNMQDAVNKYTQPPKVPAHAEIIVVAP
jgi:hypothetical protein